MKLSITALACPMPAVRIRCRWCGSVARYSAPGALSGPSEGNVWCTNCHQALGTWQFDERQTRLVVHGRPGVRIWRAGGWLRRMLNRVLDWILRI